MTPRTKSRSSKKPTDINSKIVFFAIALLGAGVVFQGFRWHVVEGDRLSALAEQTFRDRQIQTTNRGTIYAADGSVLAIDQPAWDVYASLSQFERERDLFFEGKDKYIATVSGVLGKDKEDISEQLTDTFMFVKLAQGIDADKKKALEEANIFGEGSEGFGLYFEKNQKRFYPDGKLASHILGFIGQDASGDDLGQYGIEGYYFSDIVGQEGYAYAEKDSTGDINLTAEYEPIHARDGKDFTLTIVPGIQKQVEEELKKAVELHQAKNGTAIIMNPETGAIIAMANYPDYDPNEYWRVTDPWIFKNKAVSDVYEYGSVHKPMTIAIALESGKIDKDYICNDTLGYLEIFDKKIYTWDKKPDGALTPALMLQYSNNPCIAQTALETGFEYYYPKLVEFGIGQFIGTGLQEEATSYLTPYEEWHKLDLAVTSFGQSISATPLQVISALSTLANDGNRMKPYVIAKIGDKEGETIYEPQILEEIVSKEVAEDVRWMMEAVVRKGDGSYFFNRELPGYSIAGKTGTAQIPRTDGVGYYDDRTNATFVGLAPIADPKMIMLVKLEEPKTDTYAATTAVPTWIEIFKAVADDLEIPESR